jgi:catechol 2,3-dioxygenase-like lactoylglutathione lyase family enzyme
LPAPPKGENIFAHFGTLVGPRRPRRAAERTIDAQIETASSVTTPNEISDDRFRRGGAEDDPALIPSTPSKTPAFANSSISPYSQTMTPKSKLLRMDNILIVVQDLAAAKAFFIELGLELEGETQVEGPWVDQVVGLHGVRADIAMLRSPDGHNRVELTKFHTPVAVKSNPENAPSNTLGLRRLMFAVEGLDDVVARLRPHGAELVGDIAQYENIYRLCFLRGPEGILIGLAESLS